MKQRLDSTFERYVHALSTAPISYQGDMHVYMCIVLAGFLEQVMFVAVTGYLKSGSNPKTANFALSYFRRSPNLKPDAFEGLIGRFGEPWKAELDRFLDDEDRRGSLGRLLQIRNASAHGESYGGSAPSVASYKRLVDDIAEWVRARLLA